MLEGDEPTKEVVKKKGGKRKSPAYNWCFTWNNWDVPNGTLVEDALRRFYEEYCRFMVYGKEMGTAEETPHLQGYFQLRKKMRITQLKSKLGKVAHFEEERDASSPKCCIKYCSKGEGTTWAPINADVTVYGKHVRKGERLDIHEIKKLAKEGADIRTIYEKADSIQAWNIGRDGAKLYSRKREVAPTVVCFFGGTRKGKTQTAIQWAKSLYGEYWMGSGNYLSFMDKYVGQRAMIFDEFRGEQMLWSTLLRVLDSNEFTVNVKNGSCDLLAELIILTSPVHPELWYERRENDGEDVTQLIRRFDMIKNFDIRKGVTELRKSLGLYPKPEKDASYMKPKVVSVPLLRVLKDSNPIIGGSNFIYPPKKGTGTKVPQVVPGSMV